MTYRQAFDRLGNPVYRRTPPAGRRIAALALGTALACVVMLALVHGVR